MSGQPASPTGDALERFRPLLPEAAFEALRFELERPLDPAIRVNVLKADPARDVQRWAQEYGWSLRPIPFCDTGWWVTGQRQAISRPVEHRLGFYYIQDAASMLPVSLFRIQAGDAPLVLDMAASPGGKTTHLVDRTLDRGLIIANDAGRDRVTMLRLVLQNWGAINVTVTRFPGENFGRWYPGVFDLVLLDAPCSMQNLRSTEARPMHTISGRERSLLATRQARLLMSALQAVRPGGQVVYATCTLEPEEDEAVLDAVLQDAGGAVQVEDVRAALPVAAPGLEQAEVGGQVVRFSPQIRRAIRLWPHLLGTSGFFAALLTRHGDLAPARREPPALEPGRTGLKRLKPAEENAVLDRMEDAYGFDFEPVMEDQGLGLWRRENVLYAIPERWLQFQTLPFQAVGMRLAEESRELIPSHEWVARFGVHFQTGAWRIDADQAEAWLRGEDLPVSGPAPAGTGGVVAVFDPLGRLYGRGKLGGGRLRNLLPTRWVTS